jgi:hypothetical protein
MNYSEEFWRSKIVSDFMPTVHLIVDVFSRKLIPSLDGMEEEVNQRSQEMWSEIESRNSGEVGRYQRHSFDFIDEYHQASSIRLSGIKQGVLNLGAICLYHAFEQHLMLFYKEGCLSYSERRETKRFQIHDFLEILKSKKIEYKKFSSWTSINELLHLANTLKHGEGTSSRELAIIAPHFFGSFSDDESCAEVIGRVHEPLLGLEVFVKLTDLNRYRDEIESFWDSLMASCYGTDPRESRS